MSSLLHSPAASVSFASPVLALQRLIAQIPKEERELSGRVLMAGAASMPVMVGMTFLAPCAAPTLSALVFGLFAVRAYRK